MRREVLDTTALLTEGAPVSVLRAALGEPEAQIDACVEAGLLAHDGEAVVFRHELTRQVIDDAITPTRRARLHHRILVGLLDAPGVDPAVCAHHAELAGDPTAVLRYAPRQHDVRQHSARTARRPRSTNARCASREAWRQGTGPRSWTSTPTSCSS